MSQKLNFSSIVATLAALSATGLVACGGATPPAQSPADAKEVPAASAPAGAAASMDESKPEAMPTAAADAPAAASDTPKATDAAPAKADDKPKTVAKKKAAGAKAGCGAGTCG